MRPLSLVLLLLVTTLPSKSANSCFTIHGRAHLYDGDGQLRIWHVGTHHDFEPDSSSWAKVQSWLEAGVKQSDETRYASPVSMLYLFADFLVCPTEPFKAGSVQKAKIVSASHRRYIPLQFRP